MKRVWWLAVATLVLVAPMPGMAEETAFSGQAANGAWLRALVTGDTLRLRFLNNMRLLEAKSEASGVFHLQGKNFHYQARLTPAGLHVTETTPDGQETGWQVLLKPKGTPSPATAPSPPPPAADGEQAFIGRGNNGVLVRALLTGDLLRVRFLHNWRALEGKRDEQGGYRLQGKNFHYRAQPADGGLQLTEFYPNGQASGWHALLKPKSGDQLPPPEPPQEPSLLSAPVTSRPLEEKRYAGTSANGVRVQAQWEQGRMILELPGLGVRLEGEHGADQSFRFQGKRYVYRLTPRSDGGYVLTEHFLDGQAATGWHVQLSPGGPTLPVLPVEAKGGRPAYPTNGYFADKLLNVDGFLQPNAVINVLPARREGELGFLVLDMILTKGTHHFGVSIQGNSEGGPREMTFDPVVADSDGYIYTAVGVIVGPLTPGWLTFRAWDRMTGRQPVDIGQFRILAREFHEPGPDGAMPRGTDR